ncbi:TetR family transcriptional regulator [Pediococcus ethanolidurans]|uniref:TetR/AcrR family transcriptional regulator n=1 Tax=Pediococcus ethanolidurans TaxID=319653 RepID=UPI00295343FB|nr:TetR/AcrR family transcriptional regulator [Pediococcus ethanolidurans]MDV7718458.1 TetR family transcriptional regulator [Pediococcus ethanolidurans]
MFDTANAYNNEQRKLSQESIQIALFTLMKTKPFSKISIRELTQKAGTSRMGFYRNYDSKEAVLVAYFDQYVKPFYRELSVLPDKDPRVVSEAYFHYIAAHSDLFMVLIKSGAETVLMQRFMHFVGQFYLDNVKNIPFSGDYADYWNSFVAAGLYNLTIKWLKNGQRTPIALLTQIVTKLAG